MRRGCGGGTDRRGPTTIKCRPRRLRPSHRRTFRPRSSNPCPTSCRPPALPGARRPRQSPNRMNLHGRPQRPRRQRMPPPPASTAPEPTPSEGRRTGTSLDRRGESSEAGRANRSALARTVPRPDPQSRSPHGRISASTSSSDLPAARHQLRRAGAVDAHPATSRNGPAAASLTLSILGLVAGVFVYLWVGPTMPTLGRLLNLLIIAAFFCAVASAVAGLVLAV